MVKSKLLTERLKQILIDYRKEHGQHDPDDPDVYLIGTWDGGNDSGWIEAIDPLKDLEDSGRSELFQECYRVLNYGSWAGDFHSYGDILWVPKENKIKLIGHESSEEDLETLETVTITCKIPLEVPYKTINIGISKDETIVKFEIRDGMIDDFVTQTEETIQKSIDAEIHRVAEEHKIDPEDTRIWFQQKFVLSENCETFQFSFTVSQASSADINKTIEL